MATLRMTEKLDFSNFLWRLSETIAWCLPRSSGNVADSLRTPSLRPQSKQDEYRHGLLSEGSTILSRLAKERASLLRATGRYPCMPANGLADGGLLVYQPDASFAEALACDETGGFFDKVDAPPWDTWIWYLESEAMVDTRIAEAGLLISWVPPVFREIAQDGIDIQPYGGLAWAEKVDIPLTQ